MKNLFIVLLLLLFWGCSSPDQNKAAEKLPETPDIIYHYSVLKALDNGVLEGAMTVGELKQHGELGLGTYNSLNGELIAIDGVLYHVNPDGRVVFPDDGDLIPYAVVCFYMEDNSLTMEGSIDYLSLKNYVEGRLPSLNLFYAFKITGKFEFIRCGGAGKQEKPYNKSIAQMLEERPIYEAENISGTLVGFWCPDYIGDINTNRFHLHFLSDDHSIGGHLLEFNSNFLEIGYDIKNGYKIVLPGSDDFRKAYFRDEGVDY